MTKDVIELAREAGICSWVKPPQETVDAWGRFAAIVAARERERIAREFDRLAAAAAGTSHNWLEADQPAQIIRALNTEVEGLDAATAQKGGES